MTVTGFITEDLDAVDANFDPAPVNIGTLTVSFTRQGTPGTAQNTVNMQAENNIEISDADIDITGDEDSSSGIDTDGGDDFDVKPGDSVTIEVKVENAFSSSSNIEINSLRLVMDIDDDGDFDIDDDSDTLGLDAGDDDTVSFTLTVEDDAEEGSHEVQIIAEGDDENGAQHGDVLTFELNIERESHDVRIQRFEVSPERITCSAAVDFVEVEVRIENRGSRDENEAAMEVVASSLGFRETVDDLELDQDESVTRRFLIPVSEETASGSHRISVRSFYSNTVQQDSEEKVVTVDDCDEESEEPSAGPSTTPQPPTTSPIVTQPGSGSGSVSATPTSSGFGDSVGYIALLVVLIVVAGAGIIGLGAFLLMRRS